MASHPSNASTFLTPTICFTIACTAFSIVAISTVWRDGRRLPTWANGEAETEVPPSEVAARPPLPRRRRAVDSVYVLEEQNDNNIYARLSGLVSLAASVGQEVATRSGTELLHELALLVGVLCRLQQEVLAKQDFLTNTDGLEACFDAATTSIKESLLSARNAVAERAYTYDDAQRTCFQLKAQRPVLEFLLQQAQTGPPTPRTVTVEDSSTSECSTPSLLPSPAFEEHIGITPAVDEKCFIDPPPQYSPPAGSSTPITNEKSDIKQESSSPAQTATTLVEASRLFDAIHANDITTLSDLLSQGVDPSTPFGDLRRTPLHIASHLNHVQSLALLLKSGAELSTEDAKGDTALHLAAWSGNVEALSLLLTHSAEVDFLSGRDGYSPLWCAISAKQIDAARLLLKHGARLSSRSAAGGGLLPLHQAAVTGQSAMCELLLERGAQVDCLDDDKNTPLHYAAASGSVASVKVLLRGGADIEATQSYGLTAVHWAAHKGHADVVNVLLDHGAKIDCRAREGATPLHLAASRGHVAAVKVLLERGANRRPGSASWDGAVGTPAEMAKARSHQRVVRLLRS